jgi:uncharacterized membrane protein
MMRKFFVAIAVFLSGCNSMSQVSPSPSLPMIEPTQVISRRANLVPRELKLKLTLDDPADLKVKQGDRIQKGQILSDRTSTRKPLEQQRQAIRLKLEHLNASDGVGSSQVSYAVEQAKVRQAQVRVRQAREANDFVALALRPVQNPFPLDGFCLGQFAALQGIDAGFATGH